MLMKQAQVRTSEQVAEGFHLVTLESPAFRNVHWQPGQKVQIAMGSAFVARTFTPMEWDAEAGRTRILGYAHGDGPGSAWLRDSRAGTACDVFGPRSSLTVGDAPGALVLFGDETSIGLAYALRHHTPAAVHCLLEVHDPATTRTVLARLGMDKVDLVARSADGAHLDDIERRLAALAVSGATFLLTGAAPSIQHLRRALKWLGVPAARLLSKAYWAPGKTGLD